MMWGKLGEMFVIVTSLFYFLGRIIYANNTDIFLNSLITAALYRIGQAVIFLSCGFFYLLSFYLLYLFLAYSQPSQIGCLYHTSTHGVALVRIYDAGLKCAAHGLLHTGCKNRQKFAICAPSHNFVELYLRNWGTYRQSEKKLLNSNISPICLQNMVNLGPLAADISWLVWGTPPNFNGFRILASLLQRHRSMEANQTLHDVWPSPGLVHYIYVSGSSCPVKEFYQVQNSLCVQVLCSPILAALLHGTRVVGVGQTLQRWAEGATYIRQGGHHVEQWPI